MKSYIISSAQMSDMKHCIGITKNNVTGIKHRKYSAYRNCFTTAGDDADWDNLCSQGLAEKRTFPQGGENAKAYFVSEEGMQTLGRIMDIEIKEVNDA